MEEVKFQIGRADKFSDWAAVAFFLLGLALLNHALGPLTRQTNLAAAIALFALGYVLFLITDLYLPIVWYSAQTSSQFISRTVAARLGQRQWFGATAFGVPILALFIIFNFSAYLLSDSAVRDGRETGESKSHPFRRFLFAVLVLLFIHLNRGYFNWEKPKFGQYGLTSAGMFGLLPNYLQALDYTVTVDSLLTAEKLQSAHVWVVINLHRMLNGQEKQDIVRFVENGGALLVLGDHTGLGEIMPPLSDLLQATGIQFNFDSAHYLKDGWNHAFELMPHAINSSVENEDDVGISVGASLAVSPLKAKPVITAKYGFSDGGNWLNKQQAYLGDRQYNPGELLGDIVLVAERRS